MTKIDIGPTAPEQRLEVLDVLRGLAICGILIGNMQWFSGYGMQPAEIAQQAALGDKLAHFFVHFLIEGKFYSIFSFLFGIGFAMHIAKAAERGDDRLSVFKRRLFWLLIFGLLHAYLLWAGDIVSIYAALGFLLILFRKKTDKALLRWAVILMSIPVLWYLVIYALFLAFAPPDIGATVEAGQAEFFRQGVEKVRQSTYVGIITDYNIGYIVGRYAGLIIEMRLPKILAMFLLGLYAYRRRDCLNRY